MPSLGIHFTLGADGLSVAMLLLSTAVTLAAVCITRTPPKNGNWFYASLLFISAGAIGAFASVDAFFFYMFHELALIPTFLLIGIWGSGDRQAAAWKVTIYLAFGSFVLLIGLIGLYLSLPANDRTFDMRRIAEMASSGKAQPSGAVYLLLFLGFGILVSLFPFHTWAPQAYASAPAPAAMLHAGVLKKFGLYGILRLVTPVFPPQIAEPFNTFLLILLLGNILYVGLVTISQRKLDLMLGYSSVMHMGYLFLGILSWKTLGLTGAALMLVAHGLSIAALFALSGELRERTGTLDFSELGGLAKAMPAFGLLFGFAAMASVGLPGFANFAGRAHGLFRRLLSRNTRQVRLQRVPDRDSRCRVGRCDFRSLTCCAAIGGSSWVRSSRNGRPCPTLPRCRGFVSPGSSCFFSLPDFFRKSSSTTSLPR